MLAAAREDQWTVLIELQKDYSALVDRLRPVDATFVLSEHERARKHDLIRRILLDDAVIRELAMPRLARLSALLASNRQPTRSTRCTAENCADRRVFRVSSGRRLQARACKRTATPADVAYNIIT